jgi:acyl-CoA reductase-like NAD-dependent aldehyde dehydrogenase
MWIATRTSGKLAHMADPVTDARKALDRAEALVTKRREELADAITEAVRGGEMLSKVAERAKYEREHVRRLVRARGVEPRQLRTPPPVRSRPSA